MRILLLSHGYPPVISGVTLVVQKVAREMVRRGHEVTVLTASDRGTPYKDVDEGVELRRVRSVPNPFWSEGRLPILSYDRLAEIVADVRPDVINTHDSGLLGMQLSRLEHKRARVAELLTVHYFPRYVTHYVRMGDVVESALEEITWEVTIRLINGFNHVIFPTQTQQQAFIEEGLESSSTVISNGLDTGRYRPDSQQEENVAARYQLPSGPRILAVGRLAQDKKLDTIIRAIGEMGTACQAHLLLVGRGDDRERLEELVEDLDLRDCIHFLGFVPEEDLPAVYRHSDLFTIASDVEVQSIPTLQAAATGLPIVAADAAALPELVENDKNGYLVPPDDASAFAAAFSKIVANPDLAARFGQASLDIGRQHAEKKTFDAYESLYREYSQTEAESQN